MNIRISQEFICNKIPKFQDIELLDTEGIAYHYTPHWDKIQAKGKFLVAKVAENLDSTQKNLISAPASPDNNSVRSCK